MSPQRWNPRIRAIYAFPALLLLHFGMCQFLFRHDVISYAFAAGAHTPPAILAAILVFVVVRLLVVLALPPLLAWYVLRWVCLRIDRWRADRCNSENPVEG